MTHPSPIPSVTPASLGYRMPAEWERHERQALLIAHLAQARLDALATA